MNVYLNTDEEKYALLDYLAEKGFTWSNGEWLTEGMQRSLKTPCFANIRDGNITLSLNAKPGEKVVSPKMYKWQDEAFKGYNVPEKIKQIAITVPANALYAKK